MKKQLWLTSLFCLMLTFLSGCGDKDISSGGNSVSTSVRSLLDGWKSDGWKLSGPQNWEEIEKYTSGKATPEEMETLRIRAEGGNAEAQFILYACYGDGKGVPKDNEESKRWLRKAAEQGNTDAQCVLGRLYCEGVLGVPKDEEEGKRWLRKAADRGHADAQFFLGVFFCVIAANNENRQTLAEAVGWFEKAAAHGHRGAIDALIQIDTNSSAPASDDESSFTVAESEFFKRCPEVPLQKIPQNMRDVFMASYEDVRPRLEGNDVVMLAAQQEIAIIEKTHKVEILGNKLLGDSITTIPEIRIKNAGADLHKSIVKNFCGSFIPSFLSAAKQQQSKEM